ncbi:hypothetical protein METP2_00487 [Methanosarcinales archaeon]|nr:hypothetical protein METP2_00487 [Methanosarcinales archaeon]
MQFLPILLNDYFVFGDGKYEACKALRSGIARDMVLGADVEGEVFLFKTGR